ncbi:MAG: DsrE family protein [Candidatus Magnetoovum sp. WYHC-5]|nr:DsrE family protein [Candidatus Magnetoovum sp. WYHC-5]
MAKFLFLITRGLDDPVRATRGLMLAKVAKEKGHDVHIFLTDDAVFLAKEGLLDNVMTPSGDEALSHMGYLIANKVPITVCVPCAQARKLSDTELIENATFGKAPQLIDVAEDARVFTF